MNTVYDNPVFRNFVCPQLCKELQEAGFSEPTHFYWKIYGNDIVKLVSYLFDKQGYYRDESVLADQVCPPLLYLPAFTLMDVQSHFPSYLLEFNGTSHFEISLDSNYPCEPCSANRLPDAFAKMWLQGCKQRIFKTQINTQRK